MQEYTLLCKYIVGEGVAVFALSDELISRKASAIIQERLGPDFFVGAGFVWRFIQKHPKLSKYTSTLLDWNCASGFNPRSVKLYRDAVERIWQEVQPTADYIFGCDETGVMFGVYGKQKVVAKVGKRGTHIQRDGNRENGTVLVTVCASGTKPKKL